MCVISVERDCDCEKGQVIQSVQLAIKEKDGSNLGYINRAIIEQDAETNKNAIIKLQRYKVVCGKAIMNKDKNDIEFDLDEISNESS